VAASVTSSARGALSYACLAFFAVCSAFASLFRDAQLAAATPNLRAADIGGLLETACLVAVLVLAIVRWRRHGALIWGGVAGLGIGALWRALPFEGAQACSDAIVNVAFTLALSYLIGLMLDRRYLIRAQAPPSQ